MNKNNALKLGAKQAQIKTNQPRLKATLFQSRKAPAYIKRTVNLNPIMAGNDTIGDCTSAGMANSIRALSALNGFGTEIETRDAVRFYSESTGYDPSNPATDQGGVEIDVLAYAAKNGYKLANQTLFPVWGTIDMEDRNSLGLAIEALGTIYLGVQLAEADQATVGQVWDTGTPGNQTPGSWGGHCLLWSGYTGLGDEDIATLLTWGGEQKATIRWLKSRIMEAHGVLWPQLATPLPGFVSVSNLDKIKADNASFLSGAN